MGKLISLGFEGSFRVLCTCALWLKDMFFVMAE
jgi:hypothetical protein